MVSGSPRRSWAYRRAVPITLHSCLCVPPLLVRTPVVLDLGLLVMISSSTDDNCRDPDSKYDHIHSYGGGVGLKNALFEGHRSTHDSSDFPGRHSVPSADCKKPAPSCVHGAWMSALPSENSVTALGVDRHLNCKSTLKLDVCLGGFDAF